MNWLDNILEQDEEIIYRTRRHLYNIFFALLVIILGLLHSWFLWAGLLYFAYAVASYFYHDYVITDRRVIIKKGLLNIRTEDISFYLIDHVIIRQSLFDKIIQGGTIFIFGSAIDTQKLRGLGKPSTFRNALYSQLPVTTMSYFEET